MRLYKKFCRSPGHRVPKMLRKLIASLLRTFDAMHASASKFYSAQKLVSSADDFKSIMCGDLLLNS